MKLPTSASTHVVLKVYVTGENRHLERELEIYNHINAVQGHHPGRNFIRKLLDHFYIHDLQLKNLLLPGPQTSYLSRFEEAEVADPSPRKVLKDRTIYQALAFFPMGGLPILTDFGEARFGDKENNDDIMPNPYRAPEVILRSSWDYKVDIWSIAMVAWEIVSPRALIQGKNADGIFDDRVHMAQLIALLGPPPPEFRQQRRLSSAFWDESGNWILQEAAPIPDITLESVAEKVQGKDTAGFLRWLRMALQWNPEDRPTALELLYDEWMMEGLGL
ncbi:hypothetical protein DV735_g2387, partial [Chaetothyriales sp. CBS 134920]